MFVTSLPKLTKNQKTKNGMNETVVAKKMTRIGCKKPNIGKQSLSKLYLNLDGSSDNMANVVFKLHKLQLQHKAWASPSPVNFPTISFAILYFRVSSSHDDDCTNDLWTAVSFIAQIRQKYPKCIK